MNKDDSAFQSVFNKEMAQWIIPRRQRETPKQVPSTDSEGYNPKVDNRLFGLALSGGGIRAATFSLGVLQRLGKLGILRFVDILSTASGGGYLGASWSSLTADCPVNPNPSATASTNPAADARKYGSGIGNFPFKFVDHDENPDRQVFDRESSAVRHLRAHGNWLAPHLGLFDVWTWVAITRYLVSTALNLALIPVPWVLAAMGATMFVPNTWWDRENPLGTPIALYMWLVPALLFAVFSLFIWARTPKTSITGAEVKHPLYGVQKGALVLAIASTLAALFILALDLAYAELPGLIAQIAGLSLATLAGVVGYLALAGLLLITYYALDSYFFSDLPDRRPIPWGVGAMTVGASAVAVGMLFMPVRQFLNFFSLQALYRRGLRKAYILKATDATTDERQSSKPGNWPAQLSNQLYSSVDHVLDLLEALPASSSDSLRKLRVLGSVYPQPVPDVVPRGRKEFLLTEMKQDSEPPDMPYHLIGTAVNTSGDTDLYHLGRRSDSFVLAHLYSGSRVTGYRLTATSPALKGISLSEAMAISGAAQSPNMGRSTTTSLAIIMALFNVRIGSWISNPKREAQDLEPMNTAPKRRLHPPLIWYWLKELFGTASAEDHFIYLTDGGHFDNSGIYELLKRRCKYILAVDASADMGNLATVAHLARTDLGIQMDIDLSPLKYGSPTQVSGQPFVVGRVKYPPVQEDDDNEGLLVWIPTVMTNGQKPDVLRYAEQDPKFPFNPTGDQFYDEAQFEAYRQLGHTAVGIAFPDELVEKEALTRRRLEKLFRDMGIQSFKK